MEEINIMKSNPNANSSVSSTDSLRTSGTNTSVLKVCANCNLPDTASNSQDGNLVSGFVMSENGLNSSVSFKTALDTIFDDRIQFPEQEDEEEQSIHLCINCGTTLSELYRLYLGFINLSKTNSYLQLLIKSKTKVHKHLEEVQVGTSKTSLDQSNRTSAVQFVVSESETAEKEAEEHGDISIVHEDTDPSEHSSEGYEDERDEDDNVWESVEEVEEIVSTSNTDTQLTQPKTGTENMNSFKLDSNQQQNYIQQYMNTPLVTMDPSHKEFFIMLPGGPGPYQPGTTTTNSMKASKGYSTILLPPLPISYPPKVINERPHYHCDLCTYVFTTENFLNQHRISKHIQLHKCNSCQFESRCFVTMKSHRDKEHKQEQQQLVKAAAASAKRNLTQPAIKKPTMLNDSTATTIQEVQAAGEENLNEVTSTEAAPVTVIVRQPPRRLNSEVKINSRIQKKRSNKKFNCPQCPKVFNRQSKVDWHLITFHNVGEKNPELTCPLDWCQKYYATKPELSWHVKTAHCAENDKIPCHECGKMFPPLFLKKHIWTIHTNKNPAGYKCDFCENIYQNAKGKTDHMKLKHLNQQLFTCTICNKSSDSPLFLDAHMKAMHNDNRTKDIICETCGSAFYTTQMMKLHYKRVHLGKKKLRIKKFQCKLCGQMYCTNYDLSVHTKMDHENLRFECNICKKVYRWKTHFNVHMKLHKAQENGEEIPKKVRTTKQKNNTETQTTTQRQRTTRPQARAKEEEITNSPKPKLERQLRNLPEQRSRRMKTRQQQPGP